MFQEVTKNVTTSFLFFQEIIFAYLHIAKPARRDESSILH